MYAFRGLYTPLYSPFPSVEIDDVVDVVQSVISVVHRLEKGHTDTTKFGIRFVQTGICNANAGPLHDTIEAAGNEVKVC